MVKKIKKKIARRPVTKRRVKAVVIKTKEGSVAAFTKVGPGKFAFVFRKGGKRVIGKSRFRTQAALRKRFAMMIRKKLK